MIASGCGSNAKSANVNTNAEAAVIDVTTEKALIMPIPSYIEATGNLASDARPMLPRPSPARSCR